jgi:hypothetical protein
LYHRQATTEDVVKQFVLVPALLLVLLPGAAHAKGTNVRISSAPNGTDAGESWTPLITVTMPGNGRLAGVRPRVIIRHGAMRRTFAARPAGRPGVYRARVVFPSRGEWRYGVDDGLDRFEPGAGRVHGFPPVRIAAGQPAAGKPPLPISGEVEADAGATPAALDGPQGQLPPERFGPPADASDGGGGWLSALLLAGGMVGVATGMVLLRRRMRRPKPLPG